MSEPTPFYTIACKRGKISKRPFHIPPRNGYSTAPPCGFCEKAPAAARCKGCGETCCHGCSTYEGPTGDQCPNCENKRISAT